jgi:hypothetical protein
MTARQAVLVALAAAVTLTSVAAAGPGSAKQRVAVRAKGVLSQGVLNPSGFGESSSNISAAVTVSRLPVGSSPTSSLGFRRE